MWNAPTENQLSKIPKLYSTEKVPILKKKIHLHFFIGGSDWYISEYDPKEHLFFGYAILNGDLEMAEWGYVSYLELKDLKMTQRGLYVEVDRDRYFKPQPFYKAMQTYYNSRGLAVPAKYMVVEEKKKKPVNVTRYKRKRSVVTQHRRTKPRRK